jgi:putative transposase
VLTLEYKVVCKPHQAKAIDEAIRTVQFVRNKCIRFWMENAKTNQNVLYKHTTQLRSEYSFVNDLNSMAVQASAERAWAAISRFYENCKNKISGKKGYPKFQKDNRSVEYKTSGWNLHSTKRRITFTDKKGIGELKLLGSWDIQTFTPEAVKRVRIVRRANGYYVQFCVEICWQDDRASQPTGKEIGIDVGLEHFYSDSNGHHEPNPRFLRKGEKLVKHCQRRIYSKEKHSSNRRKARNRYASRHLKISRQRNQHAGRLARHVIQSNDLVVYENLKVRNLAKNHCLAKSINDAGWYQFRLWLEHFASRFGKVAVAVEPHYTSQECPECHVIVKKSLSQRTHICACGCELQRDHAASINILNKGKAQLEAIATGGQPGSKPDKKTSKKKSSGRNAWGDGTSTGSGENLSQQVLS